jgi:hypothetical protein
VSLGIINTDAMREGAMLAGLAERLEIPSLGTTGHDLAASVRQSDAIKAVQRNVRG